MPEGTKDRKSGRRELFREADVTFSCIKGLPILRLLAALALAVGLAGCASPDKAVGPEVHLVNLKPVSAGLLEQRFEADLRIVNPNDFDIDLDGLTFDLDVNDTDFASGVSNETLTIPRLGEARLSVQASTSLLGLFQQFMTLADRGSLTYEISGRAYLNNFPKRSVTYRSGGKLDLLPGADRERTLVPL